MPILSRLRLACAFLLLAVCTFAGCMAPVTMQVPSFLADSPIVERRRYERFDPFISDDLAPETNSRPREYSQPRTIPRRSLADRIHNSIPAMQNPYNQPVYSF